MDDDVLEQFIREYITQNPLPNILFTWHGGEPLLRNIDFYKTVIRLQKKYANGKQIENSLQTNGVLLNDEWCKFFHDHNFLIGISLDGPENCHDQYRKYKDGKGSFKAVMQGVNLLQKHGVEFNVLSVINRYNAEFPKEVYLFFKSIGAHYIQFSPIVERRNNTNRQLLLPTEVHQTTVTDESVLALQYGNFLCTIFDLWVRKDVGTFFVTTFDNTLANFLKYPAGTCIWSPTCGHAPAMEHNGDVYACDHYVFPDYKLGNIKTANLTSMIFSGKQLKFGTDKRDTLPQQCLECQYLTLCYGECPKNRIITDCYGNKGLNYLCSGFQQYFKHTLDAISFMANELQHQRPPANIMNKYTKK